MVKVPVLRLVTVGSLAVLAGAVGLFGYRYVRADVAASVYRDRLRELSANYESLRSTYNDVVRRTAVTELVVEDGRLSVQVRTVRGVERTIETPFDPAGEIFVDYAVLDGRLWIRRVFDVLTPPANALVVDPELEWIDWSDHPEAYGKAVYRSLGEGRWVITTTGDGSLGLARSDDPVLLSAAPEVRDYAEAETQTEPVPIGPGEVLAHILGND